MYNLSSGKCIGFCTISFSPHPDRMYSSRLECSHFGGIYNEHYSEHFSHPKRAI